MKTWIGFAAALAMVAVWMPGVSPAVELAPVDGAGTPLHTAAEECDVDTARQWVSYAPYRDAERDGDTPLILAAEQGCLEIVRMLVENKAAVDGGEQTSQRTALMVAARRGHADIVTYLLDRGAAINARDRQGTSALMEATENGNICVARILLERGADAALRNQDGKTAWLLAAERGHQSMLQFLKKSGVAEEYAGLSWKGSDAALNYPFIKMVDNRLEWQELWKKSFDKPAPPVDFEHFAVACVFLGNAADWLYSIDFGDPAVHSTTLYIPYQLIMLVLERRMSPDMDIKEHAFGSQYHMKVFARVGGLPMQLYRERVSGR
jgi:ankyrin repeat protein